MTAIPSTHITKNHTLALRALQFAAQQIMEAQKSYSEKNTAFIERIQELVRQVASLEAERDDLRSEMFRLNETLDEAQQMREKSDAKVQELYHQLEDQRAETRREHELGKTMFDVSQLKIERLRRELTTQAQLADETIQALVIQNQGLRDLSEFLSYAGPR